MWSTWRNYSHILSYTGTVNKEEMYVEYLEKLLSDIELHRYSVWLVLWKVKVGQLREVYTVFLYQSFPLCTLQFAVDF
jgi:hypothetical protein